MQLLVGTSGFSYTEWRGNFYPDKLPESSMLAAYSSRLPTVEINNTFYRMPQPALFEGWARKVSESFTFALKAPRRITHIGKLKNVNEVVAQFFQTASLLGPRLGPTLFQLPPTFRRDDGVLSEFLSLLPDGAEVAVEFRHPSWFDERVYALLSAREVALCGSEVDPDEGVDSPFLRTAPFTYIRLRRQSYDEASLDGAFSRIAALNASRVYVYFKHEVLGPSYAQTLLAMHSQTN